MTPEVAFIENYNTWLLGALGDLDQLMAGLPRFITNETILMEPSSVPWGGTLIGFDGWAKLREGVLPFFGSLGPDLSFSKAEHFQRDNTIIRELVMSVRPTQASSKGFVMPMIEKYELSGGRIARIDAFYEDTARFLRHFELPAAM